VFTKKYILKTSCSPEESLQRIKKLLKRKDSWDISLRRKNFRVNRPYNYSGNVDDNGFTIHPDGYRFNPLVIKGELIKDPHMTNIYLTIKPALFFYVAVPVTSLPILGLLVVFSSPHFLWSAKAWIPVIVSLAAVSIPLYSFFNEQFRSKKFLVSLFEGEVMSGNA
jgi:hypothetical protein